MDKPPAVPDNRANPAHCITRMNLPCFENAPLKSAAWKFLLLLLAFSTPVFADTERASVWIGGELFSLEIAADSATRARGLMHRSQIDPAGGMLFVFPTNRPRSFWMKNCLVDMDILYLDGDGVVIRQHQMFAEPLQQEKESMAEYHRRLQRYPSLDPARFAIELKHGTAARLKINQGDRVEMDIPELLQVAR